MTDAEFLGELEAAAECSEDEGLSRAHWLLEMAFGESALSLAYERCVLDVVTHRSQDQPVGSRALCFLVGVLERELKDVAP